MKAALLVYYSVFDEELRGILDRSGCCQYFEIPKAWARNGDEKRFDTHVYPGTYSVIVAFLDKKQSEQLMSAVRTFREQGHHKEHTHLALFDLEEFV